MIFKIINGKAVRYDSGGTEKIDDLTVDFSQAESRDNITPTDSMKTILGKIMKWFSDLSAGAASSLLGQNLTAGKVLVSDDGGKVAASVVDASKVGFLSGVTSDVQGQINSLSSAKDIEIIAGNNIGDVGNFCYIKNDIFYLNAQAKVIGNLAQYQAIIIFTGYKATRTVISIGGTSDGKVAQIYCERDTNKILINTANGIAVNDWILMNFCIPVTKDIS